MDFKPTEFLISEDHITTVVDIYAKVELKIEGMSFRISCSCHSECSEAK